MGRSPGASEYIQPAGPWLIAELDLTRAIQILLHAEHHVSRLFRPLLVGNEDDLPVVRHLIKQGLDSADVAVVQRGLHLPGRRPGRGPGRPVTALLRTGSRPYPSSYREGGRKPPPLPGTRPPFLLPPVRKPG